MATQPLTYDIVQRTEDFDLWRSDLNPTNVDIVGDFAGKGLMAIHGESLLTYCLQQAKVDFDYGFQVLHAVHAVETFLAKLRDRGSNFHVLWFDKEHSLSSQSQDAKAHKYGLVRAVLIQHFDSPESLASVPEFSYLFPSLESSEFSEYLSENSIHLFLGSESNETVATGESKSNLAPHTPLRILYGVAAAGHCVGFIDDIKFKSSKAFARVETPKGSVQRLTGNNSWEAPEPSPECQNGIKKIVQLDSGKKLTTREIVSIQALLTVMSSKNGDVSNIKQQAAALLTHLIILRHSGLSQRSVSEKGSLTLTSTIEPFISGFSAAAREALESVSEGRPSFVKWDAFDLFDGRLYLSVLSHLADISLPKELLGELKELGQLLKSLSGTDVSDSFPGAAAKGDLTDGTETHAPKAPSILPFSHPVVDQYLKKVNLDSCVVAKPRPEPKLFQELVHPDLAKKVEIDPKAVPKKKGFWAMKKAQKIMADTIAYSASLTGASGKSIEPETIIVRIPVKDTGKPAPTKNIPVRPAQTKPEKKGPPKKDGKKEAPKSGREKAQEAAKARKDQKDQGKSLAVASFWKDRCMEFEAERSLVKRYLKAEKYLLGLPPTHMDDIGAEVSLYLCSLLWQVKDLDTTPKSLKNHILAMLWFRTMETMKLTQNLTVEIYTQLATLATVLQIPMDTSVQPTVMRPLPFKSTIKGGKSILPSGSTPAEFQLEYCGPYLERSFDSAPDPRVSFQPDAWQRRVLDAIDEDRSLFVVAPTSAGKTFISFYAMKKVLQTNDDDILVYVAPTKALVNQIAAEIQARFSKTYRHEGRSVWAINSQDFRVNNPLTCQVLVTVPSVLQTLLLAPSNAQNPKSFSMRIKRIIFDEVHSIGQSDEGIIWEQLLLLAPCPIIALSATVANPLEFKDWLERTQKAKGNDLEMVIHNSRYSDLRKFIHAPPTSNFTEFTGLDAVERIGVPGLDAEGKDSPMFMFVHPIGSIVDKTRETLNDATLEPRDCFTLWKCLVQNENDKHKVDGSLAPEKSLPQLVRKADTIRWEATLKDRVAAWMLDPSSPFETVQTQLLGEKYAAYARAVEDAKGLVNICDPIEKDGKVHVHSHSAFALVLDLRARGALPAILFNYDRTGCETVIGELLNVLRMAEGKYKEASQSWASKVAEYEKWKAARELKLKAAASAAKNKKKQGDEDMGELRREEASTRETSVWDLFDPEAPLSQFSFANTTKISRSELDERFATVEGKVPPYLLEALRRGLGVHHSGMNREYRQVVEMLFRKGYLTVVVATGTLAMGLNMPCKTVVFTGDSVFLSALNYRQASGRAGRRGFDLLGNVVFHNIPPHRALEIMSAKLPDLRGQFPISVTLILRLFTLLHGTNNSEFSTNALKSLLSQTQLFLCGPEDKSSIVHHLRFSIEYLRRQHLLSETGVPVNFSSLVGNMYYTENAVFAFHALLKEGYFREMCAEVDNPVKQQDIFRELLIVLSHIFCRIPCHRYKETAWLQNVVHRSSSNVILPDLPQKAAEILKRHNDETLDVFRGYVRTYAKQHLPETPDNVLPFTKHVAEPTKTADLSGTIPSHLPPTVARSPFSALSGFTDDFSSIHELCETVRAGVFIEEASIPYVPIAPAETNGVPWNAYLVDFFKHGDMGALVSDNGIKSGDVWFRLKDFSVVMASIVSSLANLLSPTGEAEEAEEEEEEDVNERRWGPKSEKKVEPVVVQIEKPKKKKKVVDSWDDSDDEEEEVAPVAVKGHSRNVSSVSAGSDAGKPAWTNGEAGGPSLAKVHMAFKMLGEEFEEKFRKTFS
ncbi:hypothetical protein B0H63DRAFT_409476 [Podospora didyma]|uniref:Helicase n=1 Tax=Podospora didyma TaxID=330526 RepID=A0AAE0U3M1_9PEZI|nr:hypothetical protein B0H63DRAFT_409476 [Podospora didyma]